MKRVIVTGASSGIGAAITKVFSQKGWQVTMIARNLEKLQEAQNQNANCQYIACDLTKPEEILSMESELLASPVHALINNAGIYRPQSIDDDEDKVWYYHFQSNLLSAIRLTRLVWPSLKKSQGHILNISSTLGIRPIANTAAYSAMKSALNSWTQSLALEGAPFQIKANAICPGIIDTPIHSYVGSEKADDQKLYETLQKVQPLGRTGKPEDISTMAYQLCSSEAQWITGVLLNIDGGILLNS